MKGQATLRLGANMLLSLTCYLASRLGHNLFTLVMVEIMQPAVPPGWRSASGQHVFSCHIPGEDSSCAQA